MRAVRLYSCAFLLCYSIFSKTVIGQSAAVGDTQASPIASGSAALTSQASQAFSAGKPVSSVELMGTAHWTAGSTKDSGPAKLTAKVTGENSAEFDLSNGSRVEAQSAIGDFRTCTWSGKDGVTHDMTSSNCWTATIWFLPHLSLQTPSLPSAVGVQAIQASASKTPTSPQLRYQVVVAPGKTKPEVTALIRSWSTTDLTLDPVTSLPQSLMYNIHPDNNSRINLQVVVRYSNYKNVSGVELPMHLERYVNGNLELSIDVDSAVVN